MNRIVMGKMVNILLASMFFCGCNNALEEKKRIQMGRVSYIENKVDSVENQRLSIDREAEVLRCYLDARHCVMPERIDFKQRCMEYYGIDIDSVGDCFMPSNKLEHQIFPKHYMFKGQLETVYYYPDYESCLKGEPKRTLEEALEAMLWQSDDKSLNLAYNRMLFHDDKSALPFFYENEDEILNLVLIHDYERNLQLVKRAAALYSLPEGQEMLEVRHLLFYNNHKRGIKKNLIRLVSGIDKSPTSFSEVQVPYLENISNMYSLCYDKIDLPIETKDECCCYLAMLGNDYDENSNKRGTDTYCGVGVIVDMVYLYGIDFVDRVRRNNYFNNRAYKNVVERGVFFCNPLGNPYKMDEVKDGFLTLKARIRDKDGSANVRENVNVNSNIIGSVLTGSDVTVVEDVYDVNPTKMVKIETSEGLIGYIHGSRLEFFATQSEYMKSIVIR